MTRPDATTGHLESTRLAAYLDRALAPPARAEVEAHLAGCPECRAELVDLDRILADRRTTPPWRWGAAAAVLAAAALVGVLLVRPGGEEPDSGRVLRGRQASLADSAARVAMVHPTPDAVVPVDSLVFSWRSSEEDASYRFTLTDERGDVVWQAATADTTLRVPPRAGLKPGAEYYWYVDALLSNGRSVTSGIRGFRTPP